MTRKWNIVNNQSNMIQEIEEINLGNDVGNEIIYNKEVLKSNLCDYNYF